MQNFRKSKQAKIACERVFPLGLALVGLVLILVLGMFAVACGGGETAASTSTSAAVASETTQAGADFSTTVVTGATSTTAEQTTSTAATTTTLKATTTTAKATTTTAKATTTTAKATTTTKKSTTTTAKATTTTVKANAILTLVGPSGTKKLSMADLKAMSASSGYGGWKNQLGNITGPMSWKGVKVSALRALVGGSGSVTVTASDGYEQTLSASVIAGDTNLYDPATGDEVSSISGSVKAILAYSQSGGALSSSDGPLRIAFVSPEKDQVTDSAMWVKMVVKIKAN